MHVLCVTAGGAQAGWGYLAECVSKLRPGGFIGLDTEFSGLGSTKHMEDNDLSVRYAAIRSLVSERAILSLGLSLFNPIEDAGAGDANGDGDAGEIPRYEVSTLDFLLKCTSRHVISADAGEFLVAHGFDFNALYERGIPFRSAGDDAKAEERKRGFSSKCQWGPWPRGMLWRLGRAAVPLIVHNGLVDLMYVWHAFHGSLPASLGEFVSSLIDALPAGVYDTKLLANGPVSESRSFLAYVFARTASDCSIRVREWPHAPLAKTLNPPVIVSAERAKDEVCRQFAIGGSCRRRSRCIFRHDGLAVVEAIRKGTIPKDLKEERKAAREQRGGVGGEYTTGKKKKPNKKARKRMRAAEAAAAVGAISHTEKKQKLEAIYGEEGKNETSIVIANGSTEGVEKQVQPENGTERSTDMSTEALLGNEKAHSAGWDAFCTAYAFASYRATLPEDKVKELHNQVKLMGRGRPLLLQKSQFQDADEVRLKSEGAECSETSKEEEEEGST